MRNKVKSLSIVLGSLLFVSCGGGGGESTPAPVVTTPFSTISGIVSDGPIQNAKVCILDVELDSEYCPVFTDAEGKYSFEYILENGKQYLITAKGDGINTVDKKDNLDTNGNPIPLDFIMFYPLKTTGSITLTENIGTTYSVNVNPVTFKEAIKTNFASVTNSTINSFISDTSTNPTTLFKNYVLNNSIDTNVTNFITDVKTKIESNNTDIQNSVVQTYVTVSDSNLKTQLAKGETYNTIGFEDLINTYIAYKVKEDARNSNSSAYSLFKTVTSGRNTIVNFKYTTTNKKYEGTVMYDTISGDLLDANYYQEFTSNDNRGANTLSGYIKIEKENGVDILSLRKGQFKVYADNYVEGFISGNVTILDARTQFSTTTNINTIDVSDATISVITLPTQKIVSSDFIGIWNGTYSVTAGNCTVGNIAISFNSSIGSWTAGNNYGTEATLNTTTNKVTLNNGSTAWSNDGALNTDKTTISGTWNDGTCTGSFTTTKQTAN